MTTVKPEKASWAKRFRVLMANHIAAMGDNITPAKRATIHSAVTLQMELDVLARRFSLKGTGAAAGDLALYAKISAAMQGLFESVGLGHQININHNVAVRVEDDGRAAAEAIELALTRLIDARQSRGVIIDAQANPPMMPVTIASDYRVEAEPARVKPAIVRDSINVVRLPIANHSNEPRQPSSTELFYEHGNSDPTWWGPIGPGGKPP